MEQFENLKVGDLVWTIQTGYSKVTSVRDTKNYPILIDGWASYTLDGKWGCRDQYNSLYLENPFNIVEIVKEAYMEGHNVCRCVTDNTDEAEESFNDWFNKFKK